MNMAFLTRVVTLLSFTILLGCFVEDGASAANMIRIIRRGRRTGIQGSGEGGYSGGGGAENLAVAPDLPALYSAPKAIPLAAAPSPASEEQSQALNEVSQEQGTTTELTSSEEQPQSEDVVGVSEDYGIGTATQISAGQETTGSSIGNRAEESNEAAEADKSQGRSAEQVKSGGYDYEVKASNEEKGQENSEQNNEIVSVQVGRGESGGYGYVAARGPLDQQQVENQDHFQVQTQAPSPVQEPKSSFEQIAALHQSTSYQPQPERKDFPGSRQYNQPQGGYGNRQVELPQPRYAQPQQLYQEPQQLYQQPQLQQHLYQQPHAQLYNQQKEQVFQQPQPQQLYQRQPQAQSETQGGYQSHQTQQLYQTPKQQAANSEHIPEPTNYYVPRPYQQQQTQNQQQQQRQPEPTAQPRQYQPQPQPQEQPQSSYQPRQYQQPEPQIQYGQQFGNQQQLQQQQYQVQVQSQQQPRALYQPALDLNNKLDSGNGNGNKNVGAKVGPSVESEDDTVTLEGLNDNIVDAELLERVQQIIEEHERQQKEQLQQQQRLRQSQREDAPKDNEVFPSAPPNEFQQQPNIYTETNENSFPNAQTYTGNKENQREEEIPRVTYSPTSNTQEQRNSAESKQQTGDYAPNLSQSSTNSPQSYFNQEAQVQTQGSYQNGNGLQLQRGGYTRTEENRGRALMENKNIRFQPAILTSHFVESVLAGQGQPSQESAGYLPNGQPEQYKSYQPANQASYPGQSQQPQLQAQPQLQQIYAAVSPQELQPAYQVIQPQQPKNYFLQQQQPHQQQEYTPYPQVNDINSNALPVQPQQQSEPERRDISVDSNSMENSLDTYYRSQGGYSQPQQIYMIPISIPHSGPAPSDYHPQQFQNYPQNSNTLNSQQETPNIITRTIVIHEQPTPVYGPDNNRAIITADDLRGSDPSYKHSHGPPDFQSQPQHHEQQQQYQYLTASAQLTLAPENEAIPPQASPLAHFTQNIQNHQNPKEITPPRPIYGVPLAPALGPDDNLDSGSSKSYLPPAHLQQHQGNSVNYDNNSDQSTLSWSQQTFGGPDNSQAHPEFGANTNSNAPVVSNTVSLPTREYSPSSESLAEQTTATSSLPYGRRIDRNIRKRFSSAITSPLAGFFSVKSKSS